MTKAEKHFKALKDTSLHLPIWYQDGLTKQWKSGKGERGMLVFLQMDPTKSVGSLFRRSAPRGATRIQDREEMAKSAGGGVSTTSHGGFKNFQETPHSTSSTL